MLGYKYNTIQEFEVDNELCNAHYGIPVNETDTTRNWLGYSISYTVELNIDFYYVSGTELVLGEPTEFEVRSLPPF
jgi:hypothetical protein